MINLAISILLTILLNISISGNRADKIIISTISSDANSSSHKDDFDKEIKSPESDADVAGVLLASGFGLLIVLFGWSEQITSKNKDTKELEEKFREKTKLKNESYQKMLKEDGATKDTLYAAIDFLYSQQREEKDIEAFGSIKLVKTNLQKLDKKYKSGLFI